MYTQECILHNPSMQDIVMLKELGYKPLESGIKCYKPKKYLYAMKGFLALEAIRYATPIDDAFLEDRIDDLVKAGALIAAEIDRLQRLKP